MYPELLATAARLAPKLLPMLSRMGGGAMGGAIGGAMSPDVLNRPSLMQDIQSRVSSPANQASSQGPTPTPAPATGMPPVQPLDTNPGVSPPISTSNAPAPFVPQPTQPMPPVQTTGFGQPTGPSVPQAPRVVPLPQPRPAMANTPPDYGQARNIPIGNYQMPAFGGVAPPAAAQNTSGPQLIQKFLNHFNNPNGASPGTAQASPPIQPQNQGLIGKLMSDYNSIKGLFS